MNNPSDRIRTVTANDFDAVVLGADVPAVVEFMSYGCSYCRALEPVLQLVAGRLASKQAFFRVNMAAEEDLAERYEVTGTPTLIMFLNGNEVGRAQGLAPSEENLFTTVTEPFES